MTREYDKLMFGVFQAKDSGYKDFAKEYFAKYEQTWISSKFETAPICHKCQRTVHCDVPEDINPILQCITPDDLMETQSYSSRIEIYFPSYVIKVFRNDILIREYNALNHEVKMFFENKDAFKLDQEEQQAVKDCIKHLHNKYMNHGLSNILEKHDVVFYYTSAPSFENIFREKI